MYNLTDYVGMLTDEVRTNAYCKALERAINADTVILNLGAGIGFFSLLAEKLGAKKIYAIEYNPLIKTLSQSNLSSVKTGRLTYYQQQSRFVDLPEQVNLIVSDLRGVTPLFQDHIGTITDARQRFLHRDGNLIPKRDSVWAAIVTVPDFYSANIGWFNHNPANLNLKHLMRYACNRSYKIRLKQHQLVSESVCWGQFDYASIESPNHSAEIELDVLVSGQAHGIGLWFETDLGFGISYSSAPDNAKIYGQLFLPWPNPVTLSAGDVVHLNLTANLIGDDYHWHWKTNYSRDSSAAKLNIAFDQATFYGQLHSLTELGKQADTFRPELNMQGQIELFTLTQMKRGLCLHDIAQQLQQAFPTAFSGIDDALNQVKGLSARFSD